MDSVDFVATADGRELLTCGSRGMRRWPDPRGLAGTGPAKHRSSTVARLANHPDTRRRPSGRSGRRRRRREPGDGTLIYRFAQRFGTVHTGATSRRMNRRASCSACGRTLGGDERAGILQSVKVWDAQTGSMVKELPLGLNISAFFSPDSRTLVTSRGDEYRSWGGRAVAAGAPAALGDQSYPGWVAFSPDGRLLAMELSPAVIHLVDAAAGRPVAKLEDPRSDRAQWLGFTPDGAKLVAISTYSRAIHVWDLREIRRNLAAMQLDWGSPPYPAGPGKHGETDSYSRALARWVIRYFSCCGRPRAKQDRDVSSCGRRAKPSSAAAYVAWRRAYANAPELLARP